ncbi:MAG TPA: hypothetical protein VIP75_06425, partial [Acidothermales bacterium]
MRPLLLVRIGTEIPSIHFRIAKAKIRIVKFRCPTCESRLLVSDAPTVTTAAPPERGEEILTDDALAFVGELHRRFASRRDELL